MDLEVKIKEEPAWLEGITTASVENFEHVSEVIALKEEVKSELAEPGSLQENYLEPSKDIKEEIFIEEHTDDQLLAYIKEEMKSRSSKVSYADHQPTDGGEPCCRCSVCGKILAGKLGLLRHLKGHKYNRPFKTDHCRKLFGGGRSLSEHLTIHPPLVCEFCHKCFPKRNMLTEHIRSHKGSKSNCGKSFNIKSTLAVEMGTHRGGNPYWCNVCGKSFIQKGILTRHMSTHTGEKPFACLVCGKSFSRKFHLERHMRSHKRKKHYCCSICRKFFTEKRAISQHMRIHTSEKSYCCEICGKLFSRKPDVARHMKTHAVRELTSSINAS
ncbi:zinc finger protein OZF [Anabrus simplex]|uniref:zinc finger protein OZF n=1 Tax=Anabrus simplex TaxID=316456 RepID=UPI0035A33B3F